MNTPILSELAQACRNLCSDPLFTMPQRSVLPGLPLWMEGFGGRQMQIQFRTLKTKRPEI